MKTDYQSLFKSFNFWLFALCSVMLFIWLQAMPRYNDDFWYSFNIFPWIDGPASGFPWDEIVATWKEHYQIDNGRLGNVVEVPLLLLPKWVTVLFCTACFSGSLALAMKIENLPIRRGALLPVALALLAYTLPWSDSMGAQDYMLNYIVPPFLAMACAYIYFKPAPRAGKATAWLRYAGVLLLALITGAWHEGFSAPLFGAFIVLAFFRKENRKPENLIMTVGLLMGIIYLATTPGSSHRAADIASWRTSYLQSFVAVSYLDPMFFVMVLTVVAAWIAKGWRRLIKMEGTLLFIGIAIESFCIHCLTTTTPRTGWFVTFSSCMAVCSLGAELFPSLRADHKAGSIVLKAVASLLAVLNLAMMDFYCMQLAREFRIVEESIRRNPHKTVFQNIPPLREIPWPVRSSLEYNMLVNSWNIYSIKRLYAPDVDITVIPAALKDADPSNSRIIPGSAGMMERDGFLFIPANEEDSIRKEIKARIDFGPFAETFRFSAIPFRTEKDGRPYYYLVVLRSVAPEFIFFDIKKADGI